MEYRQLGRTGVQVSSLCLGCMMFGRVTSPEDAYPIIDRALDGGINFLDTANVYSRGKSEEITGQALQRNGKRHRLVLATKVHGRMNDDDYARIDAAVPPGDNVSAFLQAQVGAHPNRVL